MLTRIAKFNGVSNSGDHAEAASNSSTFLNLKRNSSGEDIGDVVASDALEKKINIGGGWPVIRLFSSVDNLWKTTAILWVLW